MINQQKYQFLESFGLISRQNEINRKNNSQKIKEMQLTQTLYNKLPISFMYKQKIKFRINLRVKRSITKDSLALVNGSACLQTLRKSNGLSVFFSSFY